MSWLKNASVYILCKFHNPAVLLFEKTNSILSKTGGPRK